MKTQQLTFTSILPPAPIPSPLVLLLGLATRVRESFPAMRLTSHWLITWSRESLRALVGFSVAARHIDDPLVRIAPMLAACLANDPPAKRRQILRAIAEVHANEEALAAALDPHCPRRLLSDSSDSSGSRVLPVSS